MTLEIPAPPTKKAIYMRSYTAKINQCKSLMCIEQRKHTTCKRGLTYKYYFRCNHCKTNWDKSLRNCPCCGDTLRRGARKKTPYNKRCVDVNDQCS